MIFLDVRGTGRSARPETFEGIGHDTWTDDLDAVRQHLEHERVILFGHSYGGFLAQEYAIRYGDRLDGLILCSTAPVLDFMEEALATAQQRGTPGQVAALVSGLSGSVESDDRLRAVWAKALPIYFHRFASHLAEGFGGGMQYSAAAINHAALNCLPQFNTLDALGTITTPTLVVTGRHDWIAPPIHGAERLHSRLPRSELIVFEESGHFPFIEEQDLFIERVAAWIGALPQGKRGLA